MQAFAMNVVQVLQHARFSAKHLTTLRAGDVLDLLDHQVNHLYVGAQN